jgi:hypothetical protein
MPTMYDLSSEDPNELGLPDEFHVLQPQLLSVTLRLSGYGANAPVHPPLVTLRTHRLA